MEVAQHDEALFIGMLSIVATQLGLLQQKKVLPSTLKLQSKAIELQIKACRSGDPSDARILTALCIMSNQVANGNPKEVTGHLEAIQGFLTKRGGLHYLGMDGMLADNLMYADHTGAIAYCKPAKFKLIRAALGPPPIILQQPGRLGTCFTSLAQRSFISGTVASAADNLALLIDIYNKAILRQVTKAESLYFDYLANVVEFQLSELNVLHQSEDHHHQEILDECLTQGLLLVNHTLLRNYGQLSPIFTLIEAQFWACFNSIWERRREMPPDLLVWLVFTGVISSVRAPCQFMDKAAVFLSELIKTDVVKTFTDAREIFQRYIWWEAIQTNALSALWQRAYDHQLRQDRVQVEQE